MQIPQKAILAGALIAFVMVPGAADAKVFTLKATDIVFDEPSPLFTTATITGSLTLSNDVAPGESFGSGAIQALTLNFGGIVGTLAQIQADIAPGAVQGFGTLAPDGKSFSVFDLRFGFNNGTSACSFFCAGQIIINSPLGPDDQSNFLAFDAFDFDSASVISSYTASFQAVPEPASWALLIAGFGLVGMQLRTSAHARTRQLRIPVR